MKMVARTRGCAIGRRRHLPPIVRQHTHRIHIVAGGGDGGGRRDTTRRRRILIRIRKIRRRDNAPPPRFGVQQAHVPHGAQPRQLEGGASELAGVRMVCGTILSIIFIFFVRGKSQISEQF